MFFVINFVGVGKVIVEEFVEKGIRVIIMEKFLFEVVKEVFCEVYLLFFMSEEFDVKRVDEFVVVEREMFEKVIEEFFKR